MSLDVYLKSVTYSVTEQREAIFIREGGRCSEISREEWDRRFPGREPVAVTVGGEMDNTVYHRNITHNLNNMAELAGLYDCCWRPDEHGLEAAIDLIPLLAAGLDRLLRDPERYKRLNPSNGWGNYEGLVAFVSDYLKACIDHPTAKVEVSR